MIAAKTGIKFKKAFVEVIPIFLSRYPYPINARADGKIAKFITAQSASGTKIKLVIFFRSKIRNKGKK